jgi:hypothetical protein
MDSKPFFKSRTLWVNVVSFAVAVLTQLDLVSVDLSPDLAQFVLPVVFLINVILRFRTDQSIG